MIHSFHLAEMPVRLTMAALARPLGADKVPGLQYGERLVLMRFGTPIISPRRLQPRHFALFAQWDDESAIDRFLSEHPLGQRLADGWHVRMQYLRRFGSIEAMGELPRVAGEWDEDEPIVAVTVARIQFPQLPRFIRWGKPVESLIAEHPAALFSSGAHRPPRTVSTFSIWKSVRDMTDMVHGRNDRPDPDRHRAAMMEQHRKDFHHESAFMRFRPLSEHGTWQGRRLLPEALADEHS